jgi:uncharacterized membrane protein
MEEQQTPPDANVPFKMESNIQGVVAYFPFIGSVFIYIYEKDNKFARFHAVQSFLFWIAALGISAVIGSLKILLIGFIIDPFFQVAVVALWFFLMYKAYNNIEYELPVIGKIAKTQAYK